MKPVIVADAALRDLERLVAWLGPVSPRAADEAANALEAALDSLSELPERGRPVGGSIRELVVEFGRYGYVIRYQVTASAVRVTRLRHAREKR